MVAGRHRRSPRSLRSANILGLVYVTLPARIAVAGLLALRRRWWQLAAFTAAVVVSEVLIGLLKGSTTVPGHPFARGHDRHVVPVGHAVAASVTVIAAVIAPGAARKAARLVGAGRHGVLDPDGALPCLPGGPLAVGRGRRDPARDVVAPSSPP